MEGAQRGEIWAQGAAGPNPGIDVVYSPPSASFIRTPTKWGAEAITEFQHCQQMFTFPGNMPRRAQTVAVKSLLYKRERLWRRWRTRYFILESGDDVRSGMMRYWTKDPSEEGAVERTEK